MLNLIDDFTRESPAIRIDRKLRSANVIDVLSDPFLLRGVPDHIRSDNGPEFMAKAVRHWIDAKLRDELLHGEILDSLAEGKIVIESWRRHYNTRRPHASLGDRPPAPDVLSWPASLSGTASLATPAVAPRPAMHQH
jgi:transposase InsO family protein